MASTNFQQRLQRIAADGQVMAGGPQPMPARRSSPGTPGLPLRMLTGLLMIPLGLATRVMTQIYMEVTADAVHFVPLIGFVMLTHLMLIGGGALCVIRWERHPLLAGAVFQMWIGYGIGAALLALKDMG